MVVVSQGPGPCGTCGNLCRTSLMCKEEEGLTGVAQRLPEDELGLTQWAGLMEAG